MYFKRKAYEALLNWKEKYADQYAVLLEGARRVGKSTIAERFAANEYRSYIRIDFSKASAEETECFDGIHDIDLFFLKLQAVTGVSLYEHESAVIFDEVQLFPRARQAIGQLVKDGRYHYIETGSLSLAGKNARNFQPPSEEMRIRVGPMDYEEFCEAAGNNYELLEKLYEKGSGTGQQVNRKLMRDLRVYMAVGGMPQAVEAYVSGENFAVIDQVKRQIIGLYEDDFRRLDPTGRLSAIYHSIPAQLSRDTKRFRLSLAVGKRKTAKDERLVGDLIGSGTALAARHVADPEAGPPLVKDPDGCKMYLADTGLLVTLMFLDRPPTENEIYARLLSGRLPAGLGYLYENLAAQMIAASGRELYYHTWEKEGSTHYYEVDFLIPHGTKLSAVEVKASGSGRHESLTEFRKKHPKKIDRCVIVSQKDIGRERDVLYLPVYLMPFLCK